MPIHCPVQVKVLGPAEFEEIDYRVMGHAYASQNELGRLCDESAYEADLKARLLAKGFRSVQTQIPITVSHGDFTKKYFSDLLVDDALYDLKAEAGFVGEHEAQILNYVFLFGIQRAKLLNFRPAKVQGRLLATSLTQEARRQFTVVAERWHELTPACRKLRQTMQSLLADWGAFLDISLYQEALVHLFGGAAVTESRVRLSRGSVDLGSQRMLLHAPGVAFRLTAFSGQTDFVESHLHRLLRLTDLKAMQWINLNHSQVEFTTIEAMSGE